MPAGRDVTAPLPVTLTLRLKLLAEPPLELPLLELLPLELLPLPEPLLLLLEELVPLELLLELLPPELVLELLPLRLPELLPELPSLPEPPSELPPHAANSKHSNSGPVMRQRPRNQAAPAVAAIWHRFDT